MNSNKNSDSKEDEDSIAAQALVKRYYEKVKFQKIMQMEQQEIQNEYQIPQQNTNPQQNNKFQRSKSEKKMNLVQEQLRNNKNKQQQKLIQKPIVFNNFSQKLESQSPPNRSINNNQNLKCQSYLDSLLEEQKITFLNSQQMQTKQIPSMAKSAYSSPKKIIIKDLGVSPRAFSKSRFFQELQNSNKSQNFSLNQAKDFSNNNKADVEQGVTLRSLIEQQIEDKKFMKHLKSLNQAKQNNKDIDNQFQQAIENCRLTIQQHKKTVEKKKQKRNSQLNLRNRGALLSLLPGANSNPSRRAETIVASSVQSFLKNVEIKQSRKELNDANYLIQNILSNIKTLHTYAPKRNVLSTLLIQFGGNRGKLGDILFYQNELKQNLCVDDFLEMLYTKELVKMVGSKVTLEDKLDTATLNQLIYFNQNMSDYILNKQQLNIIKTSSAITEEKKVIENIEVMLNNKRSEVDYICKKAMFPEEIQSYFDTKSKLSKMLLVKWMAPKILPLVQEIELKYGKCDFISKHQRATSQFISEANKVNNIQFHN